MVENNAIRGIGPDSTWGILESLHFKFPNTRGGQWLEAAWALIVCLGFVLVGSVALVALAHVLGPH
jgi:hypothetical protein